MTGVAPALREGLAAQANRELFRRSSPAAMSYALLLLVVEWFTPYVIDRLWIIGVTGISVTLLGAARIALAHRVAKKPGPASPGEFAAFRAGVYLSAGIWSGFSALTLLHYGEAWTGMLVLLMTAGIAAGGLTSLAPDIFLARSYLLTLLVPSILAGVANGGTEGAAVAVTVSIYGAFLWVGAGQQNSSYWRALEDHAALKSKAAELEEATKLVDAATIAKSTFLANMSHEIRTPMNAVIGMTELLLESGLDSENERFARTIKEASESLLAIVNDILDLSRIEAGKVDLDPVDFNLRDKVHEVLRTLALRAHDKGLELSCRVFKDVPDALTGDAGRLRQVLINLVGNAIKFTEEGSIRIQIEIEKHLVESAVLHFSVADTGIGIPAEKHPLVFEPFTQADDTTTRQFGGTGLGLSISKAFVEAMNGKMWFESESGKGSTFHFTLELGLRKAPGARLPAEGVQSLRGRHVMIVEDDPESSAILAEMLQSWGMQAIVAAGSAAAMAAASGNGSDGHRVDFGLIEYEGADSFKIAGAMLETPDRPIPIMMLNSNRQREAVARCRQKGIRAYVVKPISESDLFDALMTAQGSRLAPAIPPDSPPPRASVAGRLRILLAEDNPVNQLVAQEMLNREGHTVVIASNGRVALEHIQTQPAFDLIFMDIQMPEMDGFQTTAAIRQMEALGRPRIPIIAMTAHAMKGDRERCLAAGMDEYVSKPVQIRALHDAIESVGLGGASPSVQTEEQKPVFDRSALLERLGGNTSVFRNLVKVFSEDCPRRMSDIRDAIEDHDCRRLVESAHALKGSLLVLSADAAAGAAQKLESMGRSGQVVGAEAVLSVLESEVARLSEALPGVLEELA